MQPQMVSDALTIRYTWVRAQRMNRIVVQKPVKYFGITLSNWIFKIKDRNSYKNIYIPKNVTSHIIILINNIHNIARLSTLNS